MARLVSIYGHSANNRTSMSDIPQLPSSLRHLVDGAAWQVIHGGCSGMDIYRLHRQDQPDRYLKVSPRSVYQDLCREHERLTWLQGKLPVPEVIAFVEDDAYQYLLISEIAGIDASSDAALSDPTLLVRLLAEGLKQIHAVNYRSCPFDQRLDVVIEEARQRLVNGLVDEDDLDDERRGRTAGSLYDELLAARSGWAEEDLVFTHGDYCLPNIIISAQKRISGFIDWGRAGVADRYQDLALAERSITWNIGQEWVGPFFAAYGLGEHEMDLAKIRFYKLLDEFF